MSRATLAAADAVAAGREGGDAKSIFAAADGALSHFNGGFLRSLARLLVAPCAHQDGWGEPAPWLRAALANFEELELPRPRPPVPAGLAGHGRACPPPGPPRGGARPGPFAAQGVTPREVEVMAQVIAGRSNREIAESLYLSVRTVEKHVERLLMKTGMTRAQLGRLAQSVGVEPLADRGYVAVPAAPAQLRSPAP